VHRLIAGAALVLGMLIAGMVPTHAVATPETPAQVITVRVDSRSATSGVLEAWALEGEGYTRVRGPLRVYVGEDGVGKASERRSRTPRGVFTLTEGFGRAKDPGTRLPYTRVGPSHWWVSDVRSRHYNLLQTCTPGTWCGFRQSRSEQLGKIDAYKYAIVMDYNRTPVIPGRGSAFFLHLSEGKPTQGCISMTESHIRWLLRWLDPAHRPVIAVDIGSAVYDVLD